MKISEWQEHDRPREKILQLGGEALSNAELVALVVGTGMPGLNCLDWARARLAEAGSLRGLLTTNPEQLLKTPGFGAARVARILAVREIVTRFSREILPRRLIMQDPGVLADYLKVSLGNEKREKFRVIFLNKNLEILSEKNLFAGTIDETAVYPREIVTEALACRATGVILAHNHPSGRLRPSSEDLSLTEKIVQACSLLGVRVLDHVIVGAEGYLSFLEEGLLPQKRAG